MTYCPIMIAEHKKSFVVEDPSVLVFSHSTILKIASQGFKNIEKGTESIKLGLSSPLLSKFHDIAVLQVAL